MRETTQMYHKAYPKLKLHETTEFLLGRNLTNVLREISFIKNVQFCGHDNNYKMETIQMCQDL